MNESKDIEIQADFPAVIFKSPQINLPKCTVKKQFLRVKNPLETVSQYKKRIFRIKQDPHFQEKPETSLTNATSMTISGNRCCSVDLNKKTISVTTGFTKSFESNKQKTLPRLFPKFKCPHLRYLNQVFF